MLVRLRMIECRKLFVELVGENNLKAQNEILSLFSAEDRTMISELWLGKYQSAIPLICGTLRTSS